MIKNVIIDVFFIENFDFMINNNKFFVFCKKAGKSIRISARRYEDNDFRLKLFFLCWKKSFSPFFVLHKNNAAILKKNIYSRPKSKEALWFGIQ